MSDANSGQFRVRAVRHGCWRYACHEAHLLFFFTDADPAIEFVSGEGLRPHRVRLHGRPELCNGPWLPFEEQRGDGGTLELADSASSESQLRSLAVSLRS